MGGVFRSSSLAKRVDKRIGEKKKKKTPGAGHVRTGPVFQDRRSMKINAAGEMDARKTATGGELASGG